MMRLALKHHWLDCSVARMDIQLTLILFPTSLQGNSVESLVLDHCYPTKYQVPQPLLLHDK